MKVFAINETQWIAAETEEEAIEYSGLEKEEIESVSEILEDEWDEEIEYQDECGDVDDISTTTIRIIIQNATSFPCIIMDE